MLGFSDPFAGKYEIPSPEYEGEVSQDTVMSPKDQRDGRQGGSADELTASPGEPVRGGVIVF